MHPALRNDGVAVVTGAAAGIGYAIAERLAQEGMRLVLADRDAAALEQSADRLKAFNPRVVQRTVIGDVTVSDTVDAIYDSAAGLGEVSLLVNNAAVITRASPWEGLEQWRALMEINFWAVLGLQQRFVETMFGRSSASAIVNLGSKEGITTPPGNAAYSVSKAAVRVLTEQLAHELRERVQDRVTAHLLIPGYTFTPMNFPGSTFDTPKPAAPWTARQVAERFIEGMNAGDFYIFCEDNEVTREMDQRRMQWSMDDLIHNRPALSRWHPAWREKFTEFLESGRATG